MDSGSLQFVYTPTPAPLADFVLFWSKRYDYPNPHEYTNNIFAEKTPENLRVLLRWKMARFADSEEDTVRSFIDRIDDARGICETATAAEFLDAFSDSGSIYPIFWAHCWQPNRFPIFDQHVHRAMKYLQTGTFNKLTTSHAKRIRIYLEQYIPFHASFAGLDPRDVDKALWKFGSYIKKPTFPLLQEASHVSLP